MPFTAAYVTGKTQWKFNEKVRAGQGRVWNREEPRLMYIPAATNERIATLFRADFSLAGEIAGLCDYRAVMLLPYSIAWESAMKVLESETYLDGEGRG